MSRRFATFDCLASENWGTSRLFLSKTTLCAASGMFASFIFLVATTLCGAQNTPGLPEFVSRDGDVVLNDLTTLIIVPVKSPHPMSLVFSNTVPSSNRFVFTDGSGLGPYSQLYPGTITVNVPCNNGQGGSTNQLSGWTYISGSGTVYIFPKLTTDTNSCLTGDIYRDTDGPLTAYLTQGYSPGIYDTSGNGYGPSNSASGTPGSISIGDPNGNVSSATVSCTGTGNTSCTTTYSFPGGITPMTETQTLTGGNPNQLTSDALTWNDAATNPRSVTVTYSSFTQKTTYGCAMFGDVTKTGQYFPTTITTPEGNYSITYEPTNGYPNDITGRIQKITNPQGGSETFAYSGGNSGIVCPTSTSGERGAVLTETLDDGLGHTSQKKYDTTVVANSTVVTTPNPGGNDTVYTFSVSTTGGGAFIQNFQTQRITYQGSRTAGTVLDTRVTCYNGMAVANCPTATNIDINNITAVDTYDTLGGMTTSSRVQVTYASLLLPLSRNQFDFGASTATTQTQIVYGTWNGSTCVGIGNYGLINNRPCTVTVSSGSNQQALTRAAYDSKGNRTDLWKWVSGTTFLHTSASYNTNGTVAISYDVNYPVNGAKTTYTYGACNGLRPTLISLPLSLTRSMTWDCNGDVITSVTDENGQITSFNHTTNSVADPFWRIKAVIDPLTNATNYTYTATTTERAMLFNSSASTDDVTTTIDGLGRTIDVQGAQAPTPTSFDTVSQQYDAAGHLYSTSLPCSVGAGALCPSTPATTQTYDGLNRPLVTTDGGGGTETKTYLKQDVLSTLGPPPTGENAKSRQYEYDGLGRLTSVCEVLTSGGTSCGQKTTASGYLTSYTYSVPTAGGSQVVVTQGAETRTYVYDGLGRLISETNPESATTTYTYDSVAANYCTNSSAYTSSGDLVAKADASLNHLCYAYDAFHRLTDTANNNQGTTNPCRRFRYDNSTGVLNAIPTGVSILYPLGRVAEAETDTCASPITQASMITDEWFSYSKRGEKTDTYESTPHSGGYYHATAGYAANGALQSLGGVPAYGAMSYGLDGEGRMSTAQQGTTKIVCDSACSQTLSTTFNPGGNPLIVKIGGFSDNDTYTYWPATERLKTYTYTVGSTPKSISGTLNWNQNGSLQQLAITQDDFNSGGIQTCNYLYDDLGRIGTPPNSSAYSVDCGPSFWRQTFTYDQFGNLTKTANPGITWQPGYTASTNQYTTPTNCLTAGGSPCYDANGNLIRDTFNSYTWDVYGKMSSVRSGNTSAVCGSSGTCLTYDANGNMVEKSVGGTYTEILYSPLGKTAVMSGQTPSSAYFPLPGGATYFQSGSTGGNRFFWHKDWLGSARFASTILNRGSTYDRAFAPFGEVYDNFGATTNYNFTGDTQDTISGIFDTPNRELHPNQGRWISPDPAGISAVDFTNPQTLNRYAYVANNPLGSTDPSGLDGNLCNGAAFFFGSLTNFSPYGYDIPDGACGSHDVPNAPWEVQTTFTGFSGPMGLLSGQDCQICWPLGPSVMQILAQVLSGNLAGALQKSGVIPPVTNCLPICDATTNQQGYWVGQRNGEVYCDPVSGACTVWDAKAGTWGVCDSACQLSNEMNKVWYGTDPCSDGQWLMNAGDNTVDLAQLVGLGGLLYPPLVPPAAIAGGIGVAEKHYGKYMRSSNGC
jgi:RHS repeat-associated protein